MKFILFAVLITALTFLNIGKSLHFSLAGDDWAALYYYHRLFDGFFSYFQLTRYLGIYDFSFILMGILEKSFGFNPFSYYFFSMIIRIALTLSFYPAVLSLAKDKRVAYLTCILFTFAYGGIESTNWVFNMATYVSLGFFNLFLWQYFKHLNTYNFRLFLLETFFLFASFYAAPNRMASVLIIVPILGIFTLRKLNLSSLIRRCVWIGLLLSPLVAFHLATAAKLDKNYAAMIPHLGISNFNLLFYFFSNIGSSLIPAKILQLILGSLNMPNIYNLNVFITQSFWIVLSFVALIYLLSLTLIKKNSFLIHSFSLIFTYTSIFWLSLQGGNINGFGDLLTFHDTLIGGYFVSVFSLYFISIKDSYPYLSRTGMFSLLSSLLFLIPAWLAFTGIYPSEHRYLLVPTAFLIISISVVATLLSKQKITIIKALSNLAIFIIILMNFISLQSYFDRYLSEGRKADYADKIFAQIHSEGKYLYNGKPLPFLFITDNPAKLYNSITFGFPYHMMLTDKRFGLDVQKSPFAVDNFESLINVLSNENSSELKRYGYQPVKIPLENVYFFKFENDNLTNITDEGRKMLMEKLPDLK